MGPKLEQKCCRQPRVLRAPRVVKYGSDFTGMNAGAIALARMNIPFKKVFSSDCAPECREVLEYQGNPGKIYEDVLARPPADEEYADLYVWTPPCQSYSAAGKMRGVKDQNGQLLAAGLKYVKVHRPRVAILENVKGLTFKCFQPVLEGIIKAFHDCQYEVHSLQWPDFETPQERERFILVAIRKDSVRHKFTWPTPVESKVTLDMVVKPQQGDKPCKLPTSKRGKDRAKVACSAAFKEYGVDPRTTPISVDLDCSLKFSSWGINMARTLTRTRGGQGGPWVSTIGRRVNIQEMAALQAFQESDIPINDMSPTKIGQMLGNSVPVTLIGYVLASAMYAGGLVAHMPDTGKLNKVSKLFEP